jgi:hypothetical protein
MATMDKSFWAAFLRFGISWGLVALGVVAVALLLHHGAGGYPSVTGLILFGVVIGFILGMTAPRH